MRGFGVRTRSVVAALGVMAVLALAGCSDPAQPSTLEPDNSKDNNSNQSDGEKTPPEDTPTPEPTEGGGMVTGDYQPVDAAIEAEAEDFVLEFMDAYDRAWLKGDLKPMKALYTSDCGQCYEYATYVEGIWGGGGRIEGGEYVDPKPEVLGTLHGEVVYVRVATKTSAFEVVNGSGEVDQAGPAEDVSEKFGVEETAEGWRVVTWSTGG